MTQGSDDAPQVRGARGRVVPLALASRGILKSGKPNTAGAGKSIAWRTVLVGDDDEEKIVAEELSAIQRQLRQQWLSAHKLVHLPSITYEQLAIPARVAFPNLVLRGAGFIIADVLVDVVEVAWIWRSRANRATLQDDERIVAGTQRYDGWRLVVDTCGIVALHAGRIVYVTAGWPWLLVVAQALRLQRVRDLLVAMREINNDLSTNVLFLSVFKFALVLVSVPHWVACVWWSLERFGAPRVELPSWSAQLSYRTGNDAFDAENASGMEEYIMASLMAWAGLTAMGYSDLVFSRQSEIVVAILVAILQIVFFAYVLGTLFHYLVRVDENTLYFRALLKAVDEFKTKRRLHPRVARKITDYFKYQQKRRVSAKIIGQMPHSLRIRVASEQYLKHLKASWPFHGLSPQLLGQLSLVIKERFVMPREPIFNAGDGSHELLWCVAGSLRILKDGALIGTVRSDVGDGSSAGEVAFLLGLQHPHSCVASSDSEATLLTLKRANFDDIIQAYPEAVDVIHRNILRKYGLDRYGNEVNVEADSRDEDEAREMASIREIVKAAIVDRNADAMQQVMCAAASGDAEAVRALVARGFDVNTADYDGKAPLHIAAAAGSVAVTQLLIKAGANVNAPDRWGKTPLQHAVLSLHDAVATELHKVGGALDLTRPAYRLIEAAREGNTKLVAMLVEHGVKIDSGDHDGRSALHHVAADGNMQIVDFLLTHLADANVKDRFGLTPIDEAIAAEDKLCTQVLAHSMSNPSKEETHRRMRDAALRGDVEKLKFLVDTGASVNATDYDSRSYLHVAVSARAVEAVHFLVGAGAETCVADRWRQTPLVIALRTTSEGAALLVRHGDPELPREFAHDAELQSRFAAAKERDVRPTIKKLRDAAEARKQELAARLSMRREVGMAFQQLSMDLTKLTKVQGQVFRMLNHHGDRWISKYADDDGGDDDDNDSVQSLSDMSGDSDDEQAGQGGEATGHAPAPGKGDDESTPANLFVRLMLRLPKAEAGLTRLKALFEANLAVDPLMPEDARRRAEHAALVDLMTTDCHLSIKEARMAVHEVYSELAVFLGPAATPVPPRRAMVARSLASDARARRPTAGAIGAPETDAGPAAGGTLAPFRATGAGAGDDELLADKEAGEEREEALSDGSWRSSDRDNVLPNSLLPEEDAEYAPASEEGAAEKRDGPAGQEPSTQANGEHHHAGGEAAEALDSSGGIDGPKRSTIERVTRIVASALSDEEDRPRDETAVFFSPDGRASREEGVLAARASGAGSKAPPSGGETAPGGRPPLFLSDVGYIVLFTSPRFVSHLSRMQSRADRLSARAPTGSTEGDWAPLADLRQSDMSMSRGRWSIHSTTQSRVSRFSWQSPSQPPARACAHEASPVVETAVTMPQPFHLLSKDTPPLVTEASEAAFVIDTLFRIFDRSNKGQVRMQDIRAVQAELGELGGPEVRALMGHMATAVQQVEALKRQGEVRQDVEEEVPPIRRTSVSRAERRRSSAALAEPAERRRSSASLAEPIPPRGIFRKLTKVAFLMGASRWILASTDGDADADSPTAHLSMLPDIDESTLRLDHVAGKRSEHGSSAAGGEDAAAQPDDVPPEVRLAHALASASARLTLADRIEHRVDAGSIDADGAVDAATLRALLEVTLTLPRSVEDSHVLEWCETEFRVELAETRDARLGKLGHGARSDMLAGLLDDEDATAVLTWSSLAVGLIDSAEDIRKKQLLPVSGDRSERKGLMAYAKRLLVERRNASLAARDGSGATLVKPCWVVPHTSKGYVYFTALFCACSVYDFFLVPMQLAFSQETRHMAWMLSVGAALDVVYWVQIALRFVTTYTNSSSVTIVDPKDIRLHYLSSDCLWDVLGALPLGAMAVALGGGIDVVFGLRCFRLANARYPMARYMDWLRSLSEDSLYSLLAHYLGVLLLTAHVSACVWNALGEMTDKYAVTWHGLYASRLEEVNDATYLAASAPLARLIERYMVSMYMTISLLTTLGMPMLPANYAETVFILSLMVLNLTVYAWCVGQISALVMKQDEDMVAKRAQLETVQAYVKQANISRELRDDIVSFFRAHLQESSLLTVSVQDMFHAMPVALQIEVSTHLNRKTVDECALFHECTYGFLNRLSSLFEERVVEEETVIFRAGEACRELVLVSAGRIQVCDDSPAVDAEHGVVDTLGPGDSAGEISFIFGIRHVTNARGAPGVESKILTLSAAQYKEVLKAFPENEETVMDNAIRRYDGAMSARSGRSGKSKASSLHGSSVPSQNSSQSSGNPTESASGGDFGNGVDQEVDAMSTLQTTIRAVKSKREQLMVNKLCTACHRGCFDEAKNILLNNSFDINVGNADGRRALHLAAASGDVRTIKLLLGFDADVNVVDSFKGTPLEDALLGGHEDAASVLVARGAKRNVHLPVEKVLAAAANPKGPGGLLYLLQHDSECFANAKDERGRTPLHVAAGEGLVANVAVLLKHGADVNARDAEGRTPLQDALRGKHAECSARLVELRADVGKFDAASTMCAAAAQGDVDEMMRLVNNNCSVNVRDGNGRSALHLAASNGHSNVCHFLLDCEGLELNAEDDFGNTALDDAAREKSHEAKLVHTLLELRGCKEGSHRQTQVDVQALRDQEAAKKRLTMQVLESRKHLVSTSKQLRDWVASQRAEARRIRSELESAVSLEQERTSNLTVDKPGFWEELQAYCHAHKHRQFYVTAEMRKLLTEVEEQDVDLDLIPLEVLGEKVSLLAGMMERWSNTIERLAQQIELIPAAFPSPGPGGASQGQGGGHGAATHAL